MGGGDRNAVKKLTSKKKEEKKKKRNWLIIPIRGNMDALFVSLEQISFNFTVTFLVLIRDAY